MTLYNARTLPLPRSDTLTVTKFDTDGNVESSYETSDEACTCPAGHRSVCRHRSMLPNLRPIADTHWFWDYDRHDVVDLNGMTKATFDRMTLREDREMQRALEADGEKLRQLTGEDHGPFEPALAADEVVDPIPLPKPAATFWSRR